MELAAGLTALSGIAGAVGQYQSGQYAAAQSKRAAEVGRVQADQIDASYRGELNSTIANIRSIRAGTGTASDSPTGMAIEAGTERDSNRDRKIDVGSKRMQATQDENDARFRRASATTSLFGGIAGTLGNSFSKAKSLPSFFGA